VLVSGGSGPGRTELDRTILGSAPRWANRARRRQPGLPRVTVVVTRVTVVVARVTVAVARVTVVCIRVDEAHGGGGTCGVGPATCPTCIHTCSGVSSRGSEPRYMCHVYPVLPPDGGQGGMCMHIHEMDGWSPRGVNGCERVAGRRWV